MGYFLHNIIITSTTVVLRNTATGSRPDDNAESA